MTDKTMREKIAEIVSIDNVHKTTLDERTQAILTIREIKEGQELWERAESGVLVELDDDQTLPDCHWLQPGEHIGDAEKMRINCPCSHRGFRRVKG